MADWFDDPYWQTPPFVPSSANRSRFPDLGNRAITDLVSSVATGRAQGRQQEQSNAQNRDQLLLAMQQYNQETPLIRAQHAARGDVMRDVQDFQLSGQGRDLTSTGGLRPSLLGPAARNTADWLAQHAFQSARGNLRPEQDPYRTLQPTPEKKRPWWETVLGVAGLALPFLGIPGIGGKGGT